MKKSDVKPGYCVDFPLKWLRTEGTQSRHDRDPELAKQYAADMKAGDEFPALDVFWDGSWAWVADGHHRTSAYKIAKIDQGPVFIRLGDQRAAILFSVGANGGKPRTPEDKKKAVMTLLGDEEWGSWSDREIARRCRVSPTFVGEQRLNCPRGQLSEVKSADGKTRDVSANRARGEAHRAEKTAGAASSGEVLAGHAAKLKVSPREASDPSPPEPVYAPRAEESAQDPDEIDDVPAPTKAAESSPPVQPNGPVDNNSNPIPPELQEAWRVLGGLGESIRHLENARKAFAEAYDRFTEFVTNGGTAAEALVPGAEVNHANRFFEYAGAGSVKELISRVRDLMPHVVCQNCYGDGCLACGKRGWLSATALKTAKGAAARVGE